MKCHSDGVIHHTSSPDNIFIGLAFIPFKTGILSIKKPTFDYTVIITVFLKLSL